jgi:hypothetical protein
LIRAAEEEIAKLRSIQSLAQRQLEGARAKGERACEWLVCLVPWCLTTAIGR